ncbi:MAG TPA: hypothetical protein VGF67_32960 [Ktedonobacteraceae bacterium]|jgi:hypothetical protein
MTISLSAPWHKISFDRFLHERLPLLLAEHLPLLDYTVAATDQYTCQVTLTLAAQPDEFSVVYPGLPQPDVEGIFQIRGRRLVVVPSVAHDDLEQAEVFCVGDHVEAYMRARIGKAPDDLRCDAALVKAWFPLDLWLSDFFAHREESPTTYVQPLDDTNWLSRRSHLRRLPLKDRQSLFRPGHFGRACPFETPEGPNIGRILALALGAEIRDGRVHITDTRPEATLGLEAAMIPLLEHDTPQRLLMGANMLRQWLVPPSPEPALIQSGNEPEVPDFWCGRNLLTAFLSWGEDTYEDGIVLSESAAQRLAYPHPLEPGDKLSNRHGDKGVVSRILPDAQMPHLSDGTTVELIFNFISQHARASFGQVREAVLSRVARAEGQPMIIPPFAAPDEVDIRARLTRAGLPTDGMEQLRDGESGQLLRLPGTAGWVYWGKLVHQAREKLRVAAGNGRGQRLNEYDYAALREVGANEIIREAFNTSAAGRTEGDALVQQLCRADLEQASPPSPQLRWLLRCLAMVGIQGELQEHGLAFRLSEPQGVALDLAVPIAHPWIRDHHLTRIGVSSAMLPAYQALAEANVRLTRILNSNAPASLKQQAQMHLALRVQEYCATLLPTLQFDTRVQFSGQAVLAPGSGLRLDQVGIAEELAWALFGPLVTREVPTEEVQARSARATSRLDELLAHTWVLLHRAPALRPQTFLAFHPVRQPDRVLRLHPLACRLLQADFDGDQAALFLPLTPQARREAGAILSIKGHLTHSPDLLRDLLPDNEVLWGLAYLSLNEEGRREVASLLGQENMPSGELCARNIQEALEHLLQRDGIAGMLETLERLTLRGFTAARAAGASLSPFVGSNFALPPMPSDDAAREWHNYQQEVNEWLAASSDYTHPHLGPQLLAIKSGARGEVEQLTALVRTQGSVNDILGRPLPIRHGYRDGLTWQELYALAPGARESFAQVQRDWLEILQELRKRNRPQSFGVLARAMRAEQPAIVFAHAACIGEIDPLTDPESRLFAGLQA